eukprot:m.810327 g.810327  ORF g.810327 m.810327 type:complete len:328 (+) comp23384_c2_seq12:105-1088(+)
MSSLPVSIVVEEMGEWTGSNPVFFRHKHRHRSRQARTRAMMVHARQPGLVSVYRCTCNRLFFYACGTCGWNPAQHETEGSEAHRASSIAGGDATPHASVSHNATHATTALGSSTSSVFFSTNNPLEGATATPLAKASPERAAEQHALAALAAQAPAVPDAPMLSSSAAGKEIEEAGVKAALRQRKKFFDAHKDQVDAAITLIQKAVRGHVARRRIHAQRIAKLAPNTANAHASNASELSSASVEQQQSELGSELPTARHASALNSPRTVRKSGITQRNHHEHAHSAPSSRPQSGAVHSHHYEPSEDEDEVVDEVGEAFVDSDHDSLF